MKFFGVLLLVGLVVAAPTSNENNDLVHVTEDLFPDQLAIYTAEHDIVNIYVPLNALNFEDDDDDDDDSNTGITLFFVEADIKENGEKEYKGLYILEDKKAKKLLDNGKDSAAAIDDSKEVYFAATDGIYVYNAQEKTTNKYGTLTDNIVNIAKERNAQDSDVIYILTEGKELFKVTEGGTKKTKIEEVKNAKQFVLDYSDNIYFFGEDKVPFVLVDGEAKKIEGLPENPSEVILLRPPFVIENGVPVIIDNNSYIIYANGTSETGDFTFEVKPTAYSMESTLIQYYARNKKIYEYNILSLIFSSLLSDIDSYINGKKDEIQSIATRSRKNFRPKA